VHSKAVWGVVWILLALAGSLWGDMSTPTMPGKSRSLLALGQLAPGFVAHDLDGKTITLQDYQGRPVIINFWATWCAPCRQEMLDLQKVYDAHRAAGLAVLAVSQDQQDKAETVRSYCAELGLTFLPLLDPNGSIATHYSVIFLPSTVFVHPSGAVAAVHLGPMTQDQAERYLAAIMPQPG
jgi:cytochrome c biogenesis protein CcmG, thiol:disulfide interchange protein DsbE